MESVRANWVQSGQSGPIGPIGVNCGQLRPIRANCGHSEQKSVQLGPIRCQSGLSGPTRANQCQSGPIRANQCQLGHHQGPIEAPSKNGKTSGSWATSAQKDLRLQKDFANIYLFILDIIAPTAKPTPPTRPPP